jgi:hypothetical protein
MQSELGFQIPSILPQTLKVDTKTLYRHVSTYPACVNGEMCSLTVEHTANGKILSPTHFEDYLRNLQDAPTRLLEYCQFIHTLLRHLLNLSTLKCKLELVGTSDDMSTSVTCFSKARAKRKTPENE